MRKLLKFFIILSTIIVSLGIIFVGAMSVLKWDFSKLTTFKYQDNSYQIEQTFSSISIETYEADVQFKFSSDNTTSVVLHEREKVMHKVDVIDETLTIKAEDTRKWYDYIGINFKSPKITVYLPLSEYNSLFVKTSTGDVRVSQEFNFEIVKVIVSTGDVNINNVTTQDLDISVSTGDINLNNLNLKNLSISSRTGDVDLHGITLDHLTITGKTGDLDMENVVATNKFYITLSTGSVELERCDAGEIYIKTSTGDIEGSLLSEKIFIAKSGTGEENVPRTTSGGICELTTSTGDIEIRIDN